jgi:hypothetical protein
MRQQLEFTFNEYLGLYESFIISAKQLTEINKAQAG